MTTKNYYQNNKDSVLKKNKEYREIHKEEVSKYIKTWSKLHPKAIREIGKRYYRSHREEVLQKQKDRRITNSLKNRDYFIRKKYNIGLEEYDLLLQKQNGMCAICGKESDGSVLFVDHNHSTKQVRGLLCRACNFGLGMFEENIVSLENAIKYLNRTNI